jgi:hypothetical protein
MFSRVHDFAATVVNLLESFGDRVPGFHLGLCTRSYNHGVSPSYLLLALRKNGHGCLHSVGLADPAYLPAGKEPGWLVPDWLTSGWQIHLGDARDILPSLFAQLGSTDVFIHDSLHTYEHMMWEFETAYPYLRPGGLLFADDALWNDAFHDFARKAGAHEAHILRGVGFLRKTVD